jgi:hypothetical protein
MNDLDRYDVEAMIRDALNSYATTLDLDYLKRELRDEIGAERVARQDADESLGRVIASRTEHLV